MGDRGRDGRGTESRVDGTVATRLQSYSRPSTLLECRASSDYRGGRKELTPSPAVLPEMTSAAVIPYLLNWWADKESNLNIRCFKTPHGSPLPSAHCVDSGWTRTIPLWTIADLSTDNSASALPLSYAAIIEYLVWTLDCLPNIGKS